MKIVEIQAGVAIVMQISMNGQTIELPTVSVTVQDGALVTEAIRVNGKLLGLDNSAIHVNLMCIRENKAPIIIKNCIIKLQLLPRGLKITEEKLSGCMLAVVVLHSLVSIRVLPKCL